MRRVTFSRNYTLSLSRTCQCYCKYCAFATRKAHIYAPDEVEQRLDEAERRNAKELLVLTGERPACTDLPSDVNSAVPKYLDEVFRRSYSRLDKRFASAEEFLRDTLRAHFDCLLVDVQLGGMSGIDMHARLLELGDRTPVIYLTAFDDPSARVRAQEMGCAGYFRKTDAGSEILATLNRVTSKPAAT